MKRDELKQLLDDCHDEIAYGAPVHKRLAAAIAWLERIPAGCELVGLDENHSIVRRIDGPDDLTKAGKSRQFEALECKKCNLDGPDNCWNHKVGKR